MQVPEDWKARLDAPAERVNSVNPPEGSWLFGRMPPGWRVTTGPGSLLFPLTPPEAAGSYSIVTRIFLFPGQSQEGYGVFLAGAGLEGANEPAYTAVLIRRDGQARVVERKGGRDTAPADRRPHPAILPQRGQDQAFNAIRVDVTAQTVALTVNGEQVLELARSAIGADGAVGLRVGGGLNLHVASFDVTFHLAPQPDAPDER